MKNLYLLRHGESDYSNKIDDIRRPLNSTGITQSKLVGKYLKDKETRLDKILCSSSLRTKETLRNLNSQLNTPIKTSYIDGLYLATAGEIIKIIIKESEEFDSLLIVTHNPGIESLVKFLIKDSQAKLIQQKYYTYPPCGLAHLSSNINSWQDLNPNIFDLEDYIRPNLLPN